MQHPSTPGYFGFKVIGTLKLVSGALALAVGIGVVRFLDHDPAPRAERVISHLGLDPHNHLIHSLISQLTGIDRAHLRAIQAGTFFYALLHLVEGIGLILGRDWAGYLVIGATSSLIPFEIYEIIQRPTVLRVSLSILNVGIVIYLIVTLRREHRARHQQSRDPQAGGADPGGG
jgi:uncharacterized membrane protein (DUF2068 family)